MSVRGSLEQAVLALLPLATSCTLDAHGLVFPSCVELPLVTGVPPEISPYLAAEGSARACFGNS